MEADLNFYPPGLEVRPRLPLQASLSLQAREAS